MENLIVFICSTFYFFIIIILLKYIISSIFFIRPMDNKYDILCSDIKRGIKGRIPYMTLSVSIIVLFFYLIYFGLENKIPFWIFLLLFVLIAVLYIRKYKKYDILEYIDNYSADLFDWDKIYILDIDENIKKQCFKIHNISYDEYKETYISHKKVKKILLESEIKNIQKEIN